MNDTPPQTTVTHEGLGIGARLNKFAYKVSSSNRMRKWTTFNTTFRPDPEWKAIDVGFSPAGSAGNENFFEKHYPYTSRITALTVSNIGDAAERYPEIDIVRYEGTTIPFDDDTFDVVWSNAVVEHVGDFSSQVGFLREVDRVGQRHFITTPNRWFPFEVHTKLPFVHYLPKPVFDRIATKLGKKWATGGYMNLLSRRQFERALRDAGVTDFRISTNRFLGLPMDYVAIW